MSDPRAPVTVSAVGEVRGIVPILGELTMKVRVDGRGEDASSLIGAGIEEAFARGEFVERSELRFVSGSTDGATFTLHGTVSDSDAKGLIDTPVALVADSMGSLALTFGPIIGGPFAGQTHTFVGTGSVAIATA